MNTKLTSIAEQSIRLQLRYKNTIFTRHKQTPSEYCLQLVRKNDYENFLCTLLLPHVIKSAAFAIRAFNIEVAQVEDQVSDSKIGAMRLQFWMNTLNDVYNDYPPRSPVALELHRILQQHKLSKRYFKRLIDARLNKLSSSIFVNLESLERYSDYTVSSIYYLLLEAQGTTDVNADHAASHFGKAHGLVTLIRSIPYNARKRIMVLPQDILLKNSVSSESIFQRQLSPGLKDAIFEVASCAKQHLEMFMVTMLQLINHAGDGFDVSRMVNSALKTSLALNSQKFEDKESEALLDEDPSQTQEELAESLGVTQQAVSATSLKKTAKCNLNVLFLPTVCLENYLEELRKVDFDVFHPILQRRKGILPLQLLWRKIWS